jgi:tetratricopeptide (TPR) repeat protein
MDEGLMGTTDWLQTLAALERLQPQHIIPGHGPLASAHDLALFKRIQRYFLTEVAARVARQMSLAELLTELEGQLPEWITALPVTWGTPRYAILRVYRGLVADPNGEPGWQHYKPSAIPEGDATKVHEACATLADVRAFRRLAEEFEEGGDVGSAVAVARYATRIAPATPMAWVALADLLMRNARLVPSVLEKGDFFLEAQHALQHALALDAQHPQARLALGRFLVMRAYRNGDDPAPGMMHLQGVLASVPLPAQGPNTALLAQAYFFLGMGYRTQGNEPSALACFQTALTHLPHFEPAHLAQQV